MHKLPLSVFIIALNEADRIGKSIDSVCGWVDEIIVIDSGSTDGTPSVAEGHGARVIMHPFEGYGRQKRFGEEQCKNNWVLNIDADEVVSVELKTDIIALFEGGGPAHSAYSMPIRDIMPMEQDFPRFSRSVSPVRLYNVKCGRYSESPVHDRVHMTTGSIGKLQSPLWHRSIRNLAHSAFKIDRYSTMQADDMIARKRVLKLLWLRIVFALPLGFFKAYFKRGYIFKGLPGFINAVMYGYSRFLRLAKFYEALRTRQM